MSAPPFLNLPSGVRATRIGTDRGEFAVLEAGTSGSLVVFVPGWTGSKEDFLALLGPLADAGFRGIALDQKGQFETPGSALDGDYTVAALADDLLSVVGQLRGAPVHLVGHSFGGLVARRATITAPDAVASLTMLCTGPGPVPENQHVLLRAMADAIPALGLPATWEAKRAYERAQGLAGFPGEIELFMRRRFLANHPVSLRAMTLHLTTAEDDLDLLAGTGVPVLVAFGAGDDGWPTTEQRGMAARLDAPVAIIEGAGHSPAAERPRETLVALTRFWSEVKRLSPRRTPAPPPRPAAPRSRRAPRSG